MEVQPYEVQLLDENQAAAAVYMMTRRQVVTAEEGRIVDISIPAVKIAMDLHGVKDQRTCLLRVINTFHHFRGKE